MPITGREGYLCPDCGEDLVVRRPKKKAWHFAHKSGGGCSRESELHRKAKHLFKEVFDRQKALGEPFIVVVPTDLVCDSERHVETPATVGWTARQVDLTKQLDTADTEVWINGHKADVLLRGRKKPLLVEIHHSCQVSQSKIATGLPIIELPMGRESDLLQIEQAWIERFTCFNIPTTRRIDPERCICNPKNWNGVPWRALRTAKVKGFVR